MSISLNDNRAFLPMPPAPHPSVGWTFTLRNGGVSQGPWGAHVGPENPPPVEPAAGGLNLGIHCGDDPAAVKENRRRVQAALGQPISWLKQVHGIRVLDLDEVRSDAHLADMPSGTGSHAPEADARGTDRPGIVPSMDIGISEPEADAQITTRPGIALAVQVADCLPVLLADRQGRVIGAAHAGWRSLAGGILQTTVQTMRDKVPDADLVAWLGPCIGPTAFEVGDEVREAFIARAREWVRPSCSEPQGSQTASQGLPLDAAHAACTAGAASAFLPGRKPGKWLANLPELARQQLQALGITDIHAADACTFSDPARFWSYRRDQTCGRMAGLIGLNP